MKKKERSTIGDMTVEELKGALSEVNDKLTHHRLNRMNSQSHNTREARGWRKKRAVILTKLKDKELAHE